MPSTGRCYILALSSSLMAASPAIAGGFYLQEQSPKEIGRAFSGGAAAADDPSTIFFNPAGMTELEGVQISTGGTLLFVDSGQTNEGSTRTAVGQTGSAAVGGPDGGNPFATVVPVPAFYATARIAASPVWLGLGISAPFGLKLTYNSDFFGRYDSLHSELMTINVQPSVAVKLGDTFAIGGGIDIQHADVKLSNALPNLAAGSPDGTYRVSGDDLSVGWNVGLLVHGGKAQFGLHYRSGMKHRLSGSQTLSGLMGGLASANGTQDIESPFNLPDIVTASLRVDMSPATRLMATGRFYNWSVFKRIEVRPEAGNSLIKELGYKDSWSMALGAEHDFSRRLTLRAGAMFDKTPTNPDLLSTRVPDGDRTWATVGASYELSQNLSLNLSLAHVFIEKQLMDRTDSYYGGGVSVHTLTRGNGNVDMVATSVTARF
ncbi:OmpP1/FadL family transporter [Rhizorhapis suberifaciens]|uniref:Long-chain fatty acid transport protein n=1 Tax=Rhizorhapis suberifaciens TaxID=13656 RepID=A0A840HW60_9SPHN|nr:outer membrane protein transport protein [Rhizorhapis suberifaciens]MBB4641768.1 long-chain fatty acid transport protein [Rhizorhapis suberifaciens]